MKLMDRRQQSGRSGNSLAFCGLAISLIGGTLIAGRCRGRAQRHRSRRSTRRSRFFHFGELHDGVLRLRLQTREILDFTPPMQRAVTDSRSRPRFGAAERAAVQKAVVWFDRRMEPVIGTNHSALRKRISATSTQAQFTWTTSTIYLTTKHNLDCWDTTRTHQSAVGLQQWGR